MKLTPSNHTPFHQGPCEWESSFTYLQDLGVGQIAHPPVGMYSEIHLACHPYEGGFYNRNPKAFNSIIMALIIIITITNIIISFKNSHLGLFPHTPSNFVLYVS